MKEPEKITLLMEAMARGLPMGRVYRMLILGRKGSVSETSQGDSLLDQPEHIPSEHRKR